MDSLQAPEVARRIYSRMAEAGIHSVAELHRLTGLNRSTLSLKLMGRRRWQPADLQRLADTLGTSAAYLAGEADDPALCMSEGSRGQAHVPLAELERRMRVLGTSPRRFAHAVRAVCTDGTCRPGEAYMPRRLLEGLAAEHQVPAEYLTEYADPDAALHIEAKLERSLAAQRRGPRGRSRNLMGEHRTLLVPL